MRSEATPLKQAIIVKAFTTWLSQIRSAGRPIVVADLTAGPGQYNDGMWGSPLIFYFALRKWSRTTSGKFTLLANDKNPECYWKLLQQFVERGNPEDVRVYRGEQKDIFPFLWSWMHGKRSLVYVDLCGGKFDFECMVEPLKIPGLKDVDVLINISSAYIKRGGHNGVSLLKPTRKYWLITPYEGKRNWVRIFGTNRAGLCVHFRSLGFNDVRQEVGQTIWEDTVMAPTKDGTKRALKAWETRTKADPDIGRKAAKKAVQTRRKNEAIKLLKKGMLPTNVAKKTKLKITAVQRLRKQMS